MQKIIDGKLYDTEKAELILEFKKLSTISSLIGNYKQWVDAELYRTKNGNWFEVIGKGLRCTQLNALTDTEVKIILETNPDKYQEVYGKLEEA